jgi:hypothetical protein
MPYFDLRIFPQGNCWRDEAAVGQRCADGRHKVGSEPSLNHIAQPARIECSPGELAPFVNGKEDQAGRVARTSQSVRGFDAIETWHGDGQHDRQD